MATMELWERPMVVALSVEEKGTVEMVPIVRDFADVFLEDLLGLPPEREVEFGIDVVPCTNPILKEPYIMAPVELEELNVQIEELLKKGFIHSSISL